MEWIDRLQLKVCQAKLPLNAPASLAEIERFEAETGVVIPSDYRDFLLKVGNGGVAPCRLAPLAAWGDSYWLDDPHPEMAGAACLVTPESEEHGKAWLEKMGVPDWESRWDSNQWSPMFGTIAVAEIGCGLYFSMIMTGEHRGRIFSWGDAQLLSPCFYPPRSFGEWIEPIIDDLIADRAVPFLNGRVR